MIIIILNIKYGSTYYNTFTMGVCSNYHGYFFQCIIRIEDLYEKISILRKKQLINELYTCGKCLVANTKKTASKQLLIYMRHSMPTRPEVTLTLLDMLRDFL